MAATPDREKLPVLTISLPDDIDRRRRWHEHASALAIDYRYSDGVLPAELPAGDYSGFGCHSGKYRDNAEYLKRALGCRLAHLAALRRAFGLGAPRVLIVEDDARFRRNPARFLDSHADRDWDVLYLGGEDRSTGSDGRLRQALNTLAIVWTRPAMEWVLALSDAIDGEIDMFYAFHMQEALVVKAVEPPLASAAIAPSRIWDGLSALPLDPQAPELKRTAPHR